MSKCKKEKVVFKRELFLNKVFCELSGLAAASLGLLAGLLPAHDLSRWDSSPTGLFHSCTATLQPRTRHSWWLSQGSHLHPLQRITEQERPQHPAANKQDSLTVTAVCLLVLFFFFPFASQRGHVNPNNTSARTTALAGHWQNLPVFVSFLTAL